MMNTKLLNRITTFAIGWIVALLIWRLIRKFGVKTYLELLNIELSSFNILVFILVVSIIAGFIFGSVQYAYETFLIKRKSFLVLLLNGLVAHILIMILIYLLIYTYLKLLDLDNNLRFTDLVTESLTLVTLAYSVIVNSVIVIIIEINKLLGKGNLRRLITGKFYNPQEEFRIFMFLDLKSSTTIAEKLGHVEYSRFVQDCFFDLTVIEKYKVEIYQYVGDEVVLTWKIKEVDSVNHCLQAYFSYADYLEKRADYYATKYGMTPFFKAGMHIGFVTVVEVGEIKREIAYHGDILNIAARIQEQCKIYNKALLVSDSVLKYVKTPCEFEFQKIEEKKLRGKLTSTVMYSVTKR